MHLCKQPSNAIERCVRDALYGLSFNVAKTTDRMIPDHDNLTGRSRTRESLLMEGVQQIYLARYFGSCLKRIRPEQERSMVRRNHIIRVDDAGSDLHDL
jgi:hypothetical protein